MKTLNLIETAQFLGVHKDTARDLAACGELPGAKVGRAWRFLEADLVGYLRSLYSNDASQGVVNHRSKTTWHSYVKLCLKCVIQSKFLCQVNQFYYDNFSINTHHRLT